MQPIGQCGFPLGLTPNNFFILTFLMVLLLLCEPVQRLDHSKLKYYILSYLKTGQKSDFYENKQKASFLKKVP